jgi:hypothetical protein
VASPLPAVARQDNLDGMVAPQVSSKTLFIPVLPVLAGLALLTACANVGPVVPDNTERVPPPSAREGASAEDVFLRKPWELWRMPNGIGRYHREARMLLPDRIDVFQTSDISVFAADGSDVRADYISLDFGKGSQSREVISVFVYRAPAGLASEWASVSAGLRSKYPGAKPAQPIALPASYPRETGQLALVAPANPNEQIAETFVQVALFHEGPWAVRIEQVCDAADLDKVQRKTRFFLSDLRPSK